MKVRDRITIVLDKKEKINSPTFIIGFQGVGLVGTIASQHLADSLKCELIGHIESEYLPPIAILNKNGITYPIRVYYNKKYNLIIITSEVPVTSEFAFEMSSDISELMKRFKSKQIVILEGLIPKDEMSSKKKVFGVPGNEKMKKFLEKNKIEIIKNGAILGVAGSMLLLAKENNFDSYVLMAESHVNIPDALAASNLLNTLSKIFGFKIDTSDLKKKGDKVERKIREIVKTMDKFRKNNPAKSIYG